MLNHGAKQTGLVVQEILVEGRHHTNSDAIIKILNIHHGDSIFNLNPHQAREKLESLPWVKSAVVQRKLPQTVHIKLIESYPIALWKNDQKLYLLDESGDVISESESSQFAKLLLVTGKDAPRHVAALMRELRSFPVIGRKVTAAEYVGGRRWNLTLNKKLTVKLPEENIARDLKHLVPLEQQHQVSNGKVQTIDVRLPDRSFLYMSPDNIVNKSRGRHT